MDKKRLLTIVLVTAVLLPGASAGQAAAAEDPNLVGWWTLDDGAGTVARDSSGHGNDGTLYGNPSWVSGFFGGALEFDGVDDYVDCGSDPSLDLTAWTIAFWLKVGQNKNYNGFVIKGVDAAENYEVLGFADGSMHLPITFRDGTRTFVNTAAGAIVVAEWAHFAYSYSSATGRRFYKDGNMIFSDAPSGTPRASTEPLTLGNERPLSRFVNGAMDDVRIYNRILTNAEIRQVGARPKAYSPKPADGELAVVMPLFQWTPATFALFHDVYLGTTPNLTEADLVASRQMSVMLYYIQGLQPGVTYYWRVDEIDAAGVVQTGDVWSFVTQALTAYHPEPPDGSVEASETPVLTWQAGQLAVTHRLYFSDNADAVAQGAAEADKGELTDPTSAPEALDSLTTYYWRVDETIAGGEVKAGPVWSFTTCLTVDDFESYTDEEGSLIYEAWVDGAVNGTGSMVGYWQAPFAEQKIVHGGLQSMPLDYNNVAAPYYSEAEYDFDSAQDWTAGDAGSLVVYVRGRTGNALAQLYVAVEDASQHVAVATYPEQTITGTAQWTPWQVPLSSFTGVNLAKVRKLYLGLGDRDAPMAGGAGLLYIDDIRLTKP